MKKVLLLSKLVFFLFGPFLFQSPSFSQSTGSKPKVDHVEQVNQADQVDQCRSLTISPETSDKISEIISQESQQKKLKKLMTTSTLIANSTLPVHNGNIFLLKTLQQDDNKKCGFHALKNAFYLLQATQGKILSLAAPKKILAKENFLEVYKEWVKVRKGQSIDTESNDIFALIEGLKDGTYPFPPGISIEEGQKLVDSISPFEINGVNIYDFDNLEKYPAELSYLDDKLMNEFLRAHRKLSKSDTASHTFVLGTPDYNEDLSFVVGHWISFMVNKVKGKTEYIITDSLGRPIDSPHRRKNGIWVKKLKDLLQMNEAGLFVNYFRSHLNDPIEIFNNKNSKEDKLEMAHRLADKFGDQIDKKITGFNGKPAEFYLALKATTAAVGKQSLQEKICQTIDFFLQEDDSTLNSLYSPLKDKYLCKKAL